MIQLFPDEPFALGARVSFLVTVADLAILNIGAAFWAWSQGSRYRGC